MEFLVATAENRIRSLLDDTPWSWSLVIISRASLRALPFMGEASARWQRNHAISQFRAQLLAWSACNFPSLELPERSVTEAVEAANHAATLERGLAAASASSASHAAHATIYASPNTAADMTGIIMEEIGNDLEPHSIFLDFEWLEAHLDGGREFRVLSRIPLWLDAMTIEVYRHWENLGCTLRKIDPNYSVWINWYDRRIRGERAAFDIPGDKYRKEDKKILRRLAEATDEDFWGKGHEFVNAELTRWLEEARTRAAGSQSDDTPTTPLQDPSATTYGVNQQGQLDRLPPADQVHLRDVPNQRRSYADLRAAVFELLQEGQRLGPRLQPRLERFGQSLPEDFERAEAYLVWRDGIALRRLYRAHLAVAKGKDPDPARLEPAVAEGLGEVLDLYNPFAFADDGIRAKDEATIAPQERADAEAEAAAAAPLVTAILGMPQIATADALGDIAADAEDAELPGDDPYAAQALDQTNRTKRNWIAALLEGAASTLKNPKMVGKLSARGLVTGTAALVPAAAIAFNYASLLAFITANAAALQSYVAVAFTSFPHLPDVIAQISALWQRLRQG